MENDLSFKEKEKGNTVTNPLAKKLNKILETRLENDKVGAFLEYDNLTL